MTMTKNNYSNMYVCNDVSDDKEKFALLLLTAGKTINCGDSCDDDN